VQAAKSFLFLSCSKLGNPQHPPRSYALAHGVSPGSSYGAAHLSVLGATWVPGSQCLPGSCHDASPPHFVDAILRRNATQMPPMWESPARTGPSRMFPSSTKWPRPQLLWNRSLYGMQMAEFGVSAVSLASTGRVKQPELQRLESVLRKIDARFPCDRRRGRYSCRCDVSDTDGLWNTGRRIVLRSSSNAWD